MGEYAQKTLRTTAGTGATRASRSQVTLRLAGSPDNGGPQPLHTALNQAPVVQAVAQLKRALNQSGRVGQVAQLSTALQETHRDVVQGGFDTVQRVEEEEMLQGKFATAQRGATHAAGCARYHLGEK